MIASILRLFMLAAVTAAIIATGWNEPIRYRFMSASVIAQEERALHPLPESSLRGNTWIPNGTALDRAPYIKTKKRGLVYTRNIDENHLGVSTESDRRPNLYR